MSQEILQSNIPQAEVRNDDIKEEIKEEGEEGKQDINSIELTIKATTEYDSLHYQEEKDSFLLMTSVHAPYFRTSERAAIDLVCIIDESTSMDGERITLVKEAVNFIIANLESGDRFGLVGYANSAVKHLELTKMDAEGKKNALQKVKSLKPNGRTALCAGLLAGLDMMILRDKNNRNEVSSIMLLTDGHANVGLTQPARIISKVKKLATPQSETVQNDNNNNDSLPCTINTFGFGPDHNASLLQSLSEYGNGMYTFIENTGMISETFAECIGGLISTIGKNIKLTLKVDDDNNIKINKCLSTNYTINIIKENKINELLIPDIQSEENRDILFNITIPKINNVNNNWSIGKLIINYDNVVNNKKNIIQDINISLNRNDDKNNNQYKRNEIIDLQYNRILVSEAIDVADQQAELGNLQEASKVLLNVQDKIFNSSSKEHHYNAVLLSDINELNSNLDSSEHYNNIGSKKLKEKKKAHGIQRSNKSANDSVQSYYTNTVKKEMISKIKK